jgi:hypothetical protein
MDVVAFHYADPGACGSPGVIRVVTRDKSLFQINYLFMPKAIVLRACPPLDEIIQCSSNHLPNPVGWIRLNMGLGNCLYLTDELRQNISVAGLQPPQLYKQWVDIILKGLERIENKLPLHVEIQQERVSPDLIESLDPNDVFVFGSNIFGFHDGGASERALCRFDAIYGQPEGIQGSSYAIPTDGVMYYDLKSHILRFIEYAREHPDKKFLLTKIGCGTAGYDVTQIAPFFRDAIDLSNVMLPLEFWKLLL